LQQITGLRRDASRPQAYRHHQMARAFELFPAVESFRAYFTGIDAPFATLKFGHVEIPALSRSAPDVRLPQRSAGGGHRLIGRRDAMLEVDPVAG
jgi:hypothetical protein